MIAIEKQVVFYRRNNWLNNRFYSHQVTVMVALPVVTLFYVSYSVHSAGGSKYSSPNVSIK